jgi:hypothetical protein
MIFYVLFALISIANRSKSLMQDYRLSKASVYRYLGETDSSPSAKNA